MKIAIIFESQTGNTKLIADSIAEACSSEEIIAFGPPMDVSEADLIFVGSWTDKGSSVSSMKHFLKSLENKNIAIFGTSGFSSKEYHRKLAQRTAEQIPASNNIVDYFYCLGKLRLESRDKFIELLKENPEDVNIGVTIEDFDKASTHPDERDIEDAKNFARQVIFKLERIDD